MPHALRRESALTIGTVAATATTAVFAAVALVLGFSAMRTHREWAALVSKAERARSIGDTHGHQGATTHALLLRRQLRLARLFAGVSVVVMLVAAVVATRS